MSLKITPQDVKEAYEKYREAKTDRFDKNKMRIPLGADGIDYEAFEKQIEKSSINISRRINNASYVFYPMREVEIDKDCGGVRTLSICSIRDAVVQEILYQSIYSKIESVMRRKRMDRICFSYRKGFSAPQAARRVRSYINQGYSYILDVDLSKYFDRIDHDILKEKISDVFGSASIEEKLLYKFLKVGRIPASSYRGRKFKIGKKIVYGKEVFKSRKLKAEPRREGIPQGGKVSGLLANLYLADFDFWIVNDLSKVYDIRYIRYADDFLVMLKDEKHQGDVHSKIEDKLRDLKLEVNNEKTKCYSALGRNVEYLGFSISGRGILPSEKNICRFLCRIGEVLESIDFETLRVLKHNDIVRMVISRVNNKIKGYGEEKCRICEGSVDGNPKSWMGFFSASTEALIFNQMDKKIRGILYRYLWEKYRIKMRRSDMKRLELLSLEQEFYRIRRLKKCSCNLYKMSIFSDFYKEINWGEWKIIVRADFEVSAKNRIYNRV